MIPAVFNLRLDGDSIVSGPLGISVPDPEEPILIAITRSYVAVHGARMLGAEFEFGIIRWSPSDVSDEQLMVSLGLGTTATQFYKAFGPLVSADPPVLSLQVDGIGGDGEIASLAGDAFKVYKLVQGVLSINDAFRYKEHRQEVEAWEDTGSITMRLRQLVLAEAVWEPEAFTRIFGIRGRDRATLLTELGYSVTTRDGIKTWTETEPG
jgi:hypothetical protein